MYCSSKTTGYDKPPVFDVLTALAGSSGDPNGTHPYGSASIGTIAPRLAAVIFPYLYKTNSGWYKFP